MAIEGLSEERELVRALDSRHLSFLGELDMRLLAASEFGYTVEAMVAAFGRSEATIRRHLAELKHSVFDFLDLQESTPLLNHWTRRHFACCTREAQKMIENCQIFGVSQSVSADNEA